ncbi:MAG: hypothetical protein AAF657_10950 [Acidobacteriota bacterium]
MISNTLLTLVVTILSVDQGVATIDKGRLAGLQAGDTGQIFYQLKVGDTAKRIDVGAGTVMAVEDFRSRFRIDAEAKVQAGYFVELEIPLVGSAAGGQEGIDPASKALVARLVPEDPSLQAQIEQLIRERRSVPSTASTRTSVDGDAKLRARLAELETALDDSRRESSRRKRTEAELSLRVAELEAQLESSGQAVQQEQNTGARVQALEAEVVRAREASAYLTRQLELAEKAQRELQAELASTRSVAPATDAQSVAPATDAQSVTPATDEGSMEPELAEDAKVLARIRDWAQAWSDQRVEDYLAFYARDFKPPQDQSRSQWEAERRPRILRPSFIDVQLEELELVSIDATQAVVKLRQFYRADAVALGATKRIKLAKEGGEWKILEEMIQ